MRYPIHFCLAAILLFSLSNALNAQGFANLVVNPQRVVIDGRSRSGAISLSNNGTKAATYRIRFVDFVSDEDGKIEQVEKTPEGHPSARGFLRYSPRQILLEPGQGQTVRVLARRPRDLPDGEYRAHILIQVLPDNDEVSSDVETLAEGDDNVLRGSITPTYGMALPVIVQQGEIKAEGGIGVTTLRHSDGKQELLVELLRHGNASIYGDLEATWTMPNGTTEEVGIVRGIAVYNPYPRRRFTMILTPPEGKVLKGGLLDITYRDANTGTPIATARHDLVD